MSLDPLANPSNITDPNASFLSSSCLDFLLIELVPLAYRVTKELDGSTENSGNAPASLTAPDSVGASTGERPVSATTPGLSERRGLDDDEELDAVHFRLESLGYRVGQGLVER